MGALQAAEWIGESRVVDISDGGTPTLLDTDNVQRHVRIGGIDAPERGATVRQRGQAFERRAVLGPMSPPFRLRGLWLTIGWILVLSVVYLLLTPAPPTIDIEQGDKYGHVLAFGTLMVWFAQLYAAGVVRVTLALGFVMLGTSLEFAQELTDSRSFEIADMVADRIGVTLGWLAAPPRLPNFLLWVESLPRRRT